MVKATDNHSWQEALSFVEKKGPGYLPNASENEKKHFSEKGILYNKDGSIQKGFISEILKCSHSFAV